MSRVAKQLKFFNKISSTTLESQIIVNNEKYSAIKLTFQWDNSNGHMGARKFWKEYLPTLQFYNPNLLIEVNRIKNPNKQPDIPCLLEIVSIDGQILDKIEMKDKLHSSIMNELLSKLEYEKVPETDVIKL